VDRQQHSDSVEGATTSGRSLVIDAHSHVAPAELIDAVAAVKPGPEVDDLRSRPYLYDWDARVRYMDEHGIDVQVLVPARPPMWLGMEREQVHELTRIANDGMAGAVARHPGRFVGVAVLPIVDDVMLAELERARTQLGLRGVQIYSNIDGEPIDGEPMWALYEEAARHDLPIWIHPQHGPTHPWMDKDLVNRLFYWPFETSAAMARLVFGGVMERFPTLKVVTHHLGGMVSFYGARIGSFSSMVEQFAQTGLTSSTAAFEGDVEGRFKRFYADTAVSGSPIALRCGVDFFGADHVLFGTDFPFEGEQVPVEILRSVRGLDVPDEQRDLILGGNAARLLSLYDDAPPQGGVDD
jgi:predicted TIM-barrel fold metal-dependent hydrolase